MRIKLYHVDQDIHQESFACECDHLECFPDDPDSAAQALADLVAHGEHVSGGGAAPLFILRAE
jgi:hypothetical protein